MMCALRPSVEDIAKDMELIDGEALNEFANSFDKSRSPSGADNSLDNHTDIGLLVSVVRTFV